MGKEYEVYDPDPSGDVDEDGQWQVMVEYSNKGDKKPPTLLTFPEKNLRTRDDALEAARRIAFEHRPPDPWSPQERRVFRVGDAFVTEISGAMSTFHFRTTVAQYLGRADG